MSALLRVRERRALIRETTSLRTGHRPVLAPTAVDSLPQRMRMRQSLAQFEEAFRERLRKEAAQRSRVRRVQRVRKQGSLRFTFLALSIIVTAVIVTIVMFETLAMLAG